MDSNGTSPGDASQAVELVYERQHPGVERPAKRQKRNKYNLRAWSDGLIPLHCLKTDGLC